MRRIFLDALPEVHSLVNLRHRETKVWFIDLDRLPRGVSTRPLLHLYKVVEFLLQQALDILEETFLVVEDRILVFDESDSKDMEHPIWAG